MGNALADLGLQGFLEWENQQAERHEYHRGEVFATVGARRVHGIVSLNTAAALKFQLKGSPCRVFSQTMKVQVGVDTILYPDVFVTCDAADLRTAMIFQSPKLVVEVLSPSTQSYDRGAKFTLYRKLVSLREYLLIDPDNREVQLFRRNGDGLFTVHDLTGDSHVRLESIDCELLADDVFDGVDLPEDASGASPG